MEEDNQTPKDNESEKKETDNEKLNDEKIEDIITESNEEQPNIEENEELKSEEKKDIETEQNEIDIKEEPTYKTAETKKNGRKKTIVISVVLTITIIAIMLFSIIFALLNINNNKILNGISILGIDVGNLTQEEATKKLNNLIEEKFSNEENNIILRREGIEANINANTINANFDVDSAILEAYNIGRSGDIIKNNYEILWTKLFSRKLDMTLTYDTDLTNSTIKDISAKMTDNLKEYSYYIEGKNLVVVKGKAGYVIKSEDLIAQIIEELKNITEDYKTIEIPVEYKEPAKVDLEKIRNEIYKEPKDAYIETNPTVVHVEENGIDFGITIEQAQKLLEEEKDEYEIPLKITEAKKKIVDLGEEAFPDELAKFSTIYDASAINRAYNVELATKKINGTVIMPGETFSYNKTVGSRTIEAGWKEGTAYVAGKVVPSVGGGVCQVSSTLYNTALLANLEITERTNHTFTVDYLSPSRDATVYYGSLDFCFKNTRKYPIKIVATASNGVCKISLYGIKEDVEYEVVIESKVLSYVGNTVTYINDPTLEEGKEVIQQYGFNGCKSEAYKTLKLNGKVVSKELLSKDTYSPQERIIRRGTKK